MCDQGTHGSSLLWIAARRPRSDGPTDEDRLEVLARSSPRSAVDVPLEPLIEAKPCTVQNFRIQPTPIVYNDADGGVWCKAPARVGENACDTVHVRADGLAADAVGRPAELVPSPLVHAEQLVRIAMLLVVVDQPRVRRRRDEGVERPAEVERARVSMQDRRARVGIANPREALDAVERVARVAEQKPSRLLDRPARPAVLVAPVRLHWRGPREIEIEMGRSAGGARSPRKDHAKDVDRCDALYELAEVQQLRRGVRRVPGTDEGRRVRRITAAGLECGRLVARPQKVAAQGIEVVTSRLDPHEEAVEARDVDSNRVAPRLERLDQRRAGACERVEHAAAGLDVALEERLDELGDELSEVRVEPMDVLRALPLGQLLLRPRQRHVEPAVERLLSCGHGRLFGAHGGGPTDRDRRRTRGVARFAPGSAGASRRATPSRLPRAG